MKHFFVLVISGLLSIASFAQPINPANYSSPVKVACIGNSITYGSGIPDRPRDSYPAQLGRMLGDHHFPIDNLKASIDFVLNSYPQVPLPLDSRNYHSCRNKLHNAQIVFEREKHGRVAFLGGSITYNGGWRDSICAYLQKHFPNTQFDFVAAGIPSMGSTPGAFRFERDVLGKGFQKPASFPFWTAYLLSIGEIVSGFLLERICCGRR